MTGAILRLGVLIAIFASVFFIAQFVLNALWARRAHVTAINRRLKMIGHGSSREDILAVLRKNAPRHYASLPPFIAKRIENLERMAMAAALPIRPSQALMLVSVAFVILLSVGLVLVAKAGFALGSGTILLVGAIAFCVTYAIPLMALSYIAQRRRKRIGEQFPVSLDIFVRALRAGHPIASAIDLLTKEMEDPIGSEFGLVGDEVAYGADLTDALAAMAERWDFEDIRMFVVSLSVQNETGGNLAEILQNLSEVIRARSSLYMKVRSLSSEGRMTGWMLTVLPVIAFVGLFLVNPRFYLDVAQDRMFIVGAIILLGMYLTGFVMIRRMIDIKV